ncbi:cupin domain-containing protein [Mucilaginibacter corticis]|uniref:Cupin domain-containing protein n=1 Tax=Mucilaginibacter corticis TaxID=2597670 RepID=A0A556MRM4_9SPHI|nr:cupin domain-containing protein [Mucilaginibacter corticis]TSJ42616.1 cupin domain-containing protein [Mucilaginibacter corticis]
MNNLFNNTALHVHSENMLERSRWYGPNLMTFLTTSAETNGQFSLIKCVLRKGFEPPLHVHSREDESIFILSGEINYEIGEKTVTAKAGDYVHLPRSV